jgi:hypothetical protein
MKMESEKGVVVVPAMPTNMAGAVTFWRLAGVVDYALLAQEWQDAGLPSKLLPDLPTPTVALHRAVEEAREARRLVRPLKNRAGWAIVRERTSGEDDLTYAIETRVRLDAVGSLIVEPSDTPEAGELRARYDAYLQTLTLGDISGWLSRTTARLKAVPLRDTGGVYFMPRPSVDEWASIGAALGSASACVVHRIPALQTAEAVAAILDAVALETEGEAARMDEEITKLGGKGLQNRLERCEEVEAKVAFYEALLGTHASALHDRLEGLKASIAAALLSGSGDDAQVNIGTV